MVRGNIQVGLEVLGNFSDESLEGELSDEELGRSAISSSCYERNGKNLLLVSPDLS